MVVTLVLASGTAAYADDSTAPRPGVAKDSVVSEVRAGAFFNGVELNPQYFLPEWNTITSSKLEAVNFELLFHSPETDVFRWLGAPRPDIGATVNLAGHESMAHVGLVWHTPIASSKFWLEGGLGAAIHNGALSGAVPPQRDLGCRALIYAQASVGYDFTDQVSGMLTIDHASHGHLCGWENNGLNGIGFRVGYKF
jgi:lipid A 3-O-deacylase